MVKACRKCGVVKTVDQFSRSAGAKDGLQPYCKPCHRASVKASAAKKPDEYRQRRRDYEARNPDVIARNAFRQCARQRGLDPDEVEIQFRSHDRLCEICGLTAVQSCAARRRLSIDHDHATGAFRGFLCSGCNAGLGGFSDDPDRLVAAIRYLAAHRARTPSAA